MESGTLNREQIADPQRRGEILAMGEEVAGKVEG
jgi:hypothetical protein